MDANVNFEALRKRLKDAARDVPTAENCLQNNLTKQFKHLFFQ
jgi:hypothetical protein